MPETLLKKFLKYSATILQHVICTFEHGYLNGSKVGFTEHEVESWQVYGVKQVRITVSERHDSVESREHLSERGCVTAV